MRFYEAQQFDVVGRHYDAIASQQSVAYIAKNLAEPSLEAYALSDVALMLSRMGRPLVAMDVLAPLGARPPHWYLSKSRVDVGRSGDGAKPSARDVSSRGRAELIANEAWSIVMANGLGILPNGYGEAQELLHEASDLYRADGNIEGQRAALADLAWISLQQGAIDRARQFLDESKLLPPAESAQTRWRAEVDDRLLRGEIALAAGRNDEAARIFTRAAISRPADDGIGAGNAGEALLQSRALYGIARVAHAQGHPTTEWLRAAFYLLHLGLRWGSHVHYSAWQSVERERVTRTYVDHLQRLDRPDLLFQAGATLALSYAHLPAGGPPQEDLSPRHAKRLEDAELYLVRASSRLEQAREKAETCTGGVQTCSVPVELARAEVAGAQQQLSKLRTAAAKPEPVSLTALQDSLPPRSAILIPVETSAHRLLVLATKSRVEAVSLQELDARSRQVDHIYVVEGRAWPELYSATRSSATTTFSLIPHPNWLANATRRPDEEERISALGILDPDDSVPDVRKQRDLLAAAFGRGVRLRVGSLSSSVAASLIADATYLHYSGHYLLPNFGQSGGLSPALLQRQEAWLTGLLFSHGTTLSAGDFIRLPRVPKHIALLGCRTNASGSIARYTNLGLHHVLLQLGASWVVTTNRMIAPAEANRLAKLFYEYDGAESPATALRKMRGLENQRDRRLGDVLELWGLAK